MAAVHTGDGVHVYHEVDYYWNSPNKIWHVYEVSQNVPFDFWPNKTNMTIYVPFEFSRFRVDEFVKFDEFSEELPLHTKWLGGLKISLIPTFDYYW